MPNRWQSDALEKLAEKKANEEFIEQNPHLQLDLRGFYEGLGENKPIGPVPDEPAPRPPVEDSTLLHKLNSYLNRR